MKLSKIIEKDINTATILILSDYVSIKMCFSKGYIRTKKYKSLEIDVPVREISTDTVRHLGITRYRAYEDNKIPYINIYNGTKPLR